MCCILLSLSHPDFALVLASNRDEVVSRPTKASTWHSFETAEATSSKTGDSTSKDEVAAQGQVLSGVDVSPNGGGTWLGITREGRLAALTNISYDAHFDPAVAYKSRGALLRQWLLMGSNNVPNGDNRHDGDASFIEEVQRDADQYPGFNLLFGTTKMTPSGSGSEGEKQAAISLFHACNRDSEGAKGFSVDDLLQGTGSGSSSSTIALACPPPETDLTKDREDRQPIAKSCGFSNEAGGGDGEKPVWEKVRLGQRLLDEAMDKYVRSVSDTGAQRGANGANGQVQRREQDEASRRRQEEILAEELFSILRTSSDPPPETNEDRKKSILIPPLELGRGSYFATRTSTVILVRRNGKDGQAPLARWWERDVYQDVDEEPVPACLPSDEAKRTQRYFDWTLGQ